MSARKEKEPPDAVHLNRLLCERVRKELRCQRLHTEHCINPLQKNSSSVMGHQTAQVLHMIL
uniref:Uncharacterized protein n=1 Tax=Coturnix japonica TaxID=93934 RepID=A0A8C2T9R1_COTJA